MMSKKGSKVEHPTQQIPSSEQMSGSISASELSHAEQLRNQKLLDTSQ